MPCTLWQSMHVATLPSFLARSWPCLLVWYSLTTSTRAAGLKRFMYAADEWHFPQNAGIAARAGLPTYGFALKFASIAPAGSSASFGSGLPPWQSWQERFSDVCTSSLKCASFAFAAASNISDCTWQPMHDVFGGGAACALLAARSMMMRPISAATTAATPRRGAVGGGG